MMPPPKRPKSDALWSTLCTEADNRQPERKYCNVDNNDVHVASVNSHDAAAAAMSSGQSAHCIEVISTVCCNSPLDLRHTDASRTDDRSVTDDDDATGSRNRTSSTTLRRLLLEPLTSASDSHRSLATTSSVAAASRPAAAYIVERLPPARCRAGLSGTRQAVAPSTAARTRQADVGLSRNLSSGALRRILLNINDNHDVGKHPHRPVSTSLHQSSDCLFVCVTGVSQSQRSSCAESSDARALPHQSTTSCDSSDTASSLLTKYAQFDSRLASSQFTEQLK